MALQTRGFQSSQVPRAPNIPRNIGSVDVNEIVAGVKRGLEGFEAVRRAPKSMILADAQMDAATAAAPLGTRQLTAETLATEQQSPLRTSILAQQDEKLRNEAPLLLRKLEHETSPAYMDAKITSMLRSLQPANVREFELMTAHLTPAEKERARAIALGLIPRTSGAAISYQKIVGPDGRESFVALDPRAVGAHIVGSGATYGSGVPTPGVTPPASAAPSVATAPVVPVAVDPLAVDGIDEFGNPVAPVPPVAAPAASPATQAPVPTTNLFQSPTLQERKAQEVTGAKTAEMVVEAKQKLPKAYTALRSLEEDTARIARDIDATIKNVTPQTAGFGAYLKGVPTTPAKTLEAQLKSINARSGFDQLQTMRNNSPTGGALGNVSDFEGENLQSTIRKLDQKLDPKVLKEFLLEVKKVRQDAARQARSAFDRDVKFFGLSDSDISLQGDGPPAASATPSIDQLLEKYK